MRRRAFITLLGAMAAAWPIAVRAQQQERARRIALLADFSEAQMRPLISAFRERLEKLGWTDASARIDYRLAVGNAALFQAAAAALTSSAPDVIVTQGS